MCIAGLIPSGTGLTLMPECRCRIDTLPVSMHMPFSRYSGIPAFTYSSRGVSWFFSLLVFFCLARKNVNGAEPRTGPVPAFQTGSQRTTDLRLNLENCILYLLCILLCYAVPS
jgi:hypothetical protein